MFLDLAGATRTPAVVAFLPRRDRPLALAYTTMTILLSKWGRGALQPLRRWHSDAEIMLTRSFQGVEPGARLPDVLIEGYCHLEEGRAKAARVYRAACHKAKGGR